MILFSRYSNERDPRFAIRTDIIREDDRMIVRKSADGYGSRVHIEHMAEAEKRLLTAFQGTRFVPNRVLSYEIGRAHV